MEKSLIIMAAGMGSRYGGSKQTERIGPNGEFILDYSIYDAIKAGFNHVVFIIKKEQKELFDKSITSRIKNKVKVSYAFQDINNVPYFVKIPKERVKPWGTAHAVLSSKDIVKGSFAVINADDFYGKDAFQKASNFLDNNEQNNYALVGYKASNTLSEYGACKRGVCIEENNYLKDINECGLIKENNTIKATKLSNNETFNIKDDDLVSMNLFAFTNDFFHYLTKYQDDFFKENINNLETCEYFLPDVVFYTIKNDNKKVNILKTNSVWKGITYKEDKPLIVNYINKSIKQEDYPENLWK